MHIVNYSSDIPHTPSSYSSTPEGQHSPHTPCLLLRLNTHNHTSATRGWQLWNAQHKTRVGEKPQTTVRAEEFALPAAVLSGWKAEHSSAPPLCRALSAPRELKASQSRAHQLSIFSQERPEHILQPHTRVCFSQHD